CKADGIIMAKGRQSWGAGSIFAVQQSDHQRSVGQVLDLMLPNVVSCAFYNVRFSEGTWPSISGLPFERIISALGTTREKLDSGKWKVIGTLGLQLERQFWPNEEFRDLQWVGAKTYGSRIVEKFLEAYFGSAPCDRY